MTKLWAKKEFPKGFFNKIRGAAAQKNAAAESLPGNTYTLELAPDSSAGRLSLRPAAYMGGRRRGIPRLLAVAAVVLLAGLGVFWSVSGGEAAAEELPFRLHIIANSDSAVDQALKLQVRDAVVDHLTPLLAEARTREQARETVLAELDALQALAQGICSDFAYGAYAEVGSFDFPPKRYGAAVLPAGEYQALRIVLGEGAGHNWWCVLFPPLCFVDECGEAETAGMDRSSGSLLQGEREVRLKMAEIFARAE